MKTLRPIHGKMFLPDDCSDIDWAPVQQVNEGRERRRRRSRKGGAEQTATKRTHHTQRHHTMADQQDRPLTADEIAEFKRTNAARVIDPFGMYDECGQHHPCGAVLSIDPPKTLAELNDWNAWVAEHRLTN
jgi:hypothetical protein